MSTVDKVAEFAFNAGVSMKQPMVIVDDFIWRQLVDEVRQQVTHIQDPNEVNTVIRIAGFKVIPCHFPINGMFCVEDSVWGKVKEAMSIMVFPILGVNMDPDWTWMAKGISKPSDIA